MGVYYYTYVGPYAEIVCKEPETKTQDTCRNSDDCPDSSDRFCKKCGLENTKRFKSVKTHFDPLFTLEEDAMSEPLRENRGLGRTVYLTPNRQNTYSHNYNRDNTGAVSPISAEDIDTGLMQFKADYAAELLTLGERDEVESIKVRWGVISYSM